MPGVSQQTGRSGMDSANDAVVPAVESRQNNVLRYVCALLILYVASVIVISFASIPLYYQRVVALDVPALVVGGETWVNNELVAQWASERGMDLHTYALYTFTLNIVITLGFALVAGVILWKAHRKWFHWFTALVLLFVPTGMLWEITMVTRIALNYIGLGSLLWPTYLLFLYLFPNGTGVPKWTRWFLGAAVLVHLAVQSAGVLAIFGAISAEQMAIAFQFFPVALAAFPLILFSQVYRYARVSDRTERAQIRWFVAGLAIWLLLDYAVELFASINTPTAASQTGLAGDISSLLMLIIPAAIGFGILRYRLYDIDVIIRRTLIYGLLTAVLAAMYFGGVILMQLLFSALTGEQGQSTLAIVVSTLAIAALFHPLRRRIQNFIDRRFYRQRYSAEETLQNFAALARNELVVEDLSSRLIGVVKNTMQPADVSLWLRDIPPVGENPVKKS